MKTVYPRQDRASATPQGPPGRGSAKGRPPGHRPEGKPRSRRAPHPNAPNPTQQDGALQALQEPHRPTAPAPPTTPPPSTPTQPQPPHQTPRHPLPHPATPTTTTPQTSHPSPRPHPHQPAAPQPRPPGTGAEEGPIPGEHRGQKGRWGHRRTGGTPEPQAQRGKASVVTPAFLVRVNPLTEFASSPTGELYP
ncbi:uncharacterized protein LOC144043973 [Vanacampus margaritifer]